MAVRAPRNAGDGTEALAGEHGSVPSERTSHRFKLDSCDS